MDQRQPALGGQRTYQLLAVVAVTVEGEDLGPVALGGRPLQSRGIVGHEDRRMCSQAGRGQCHGLRVVSRGNRAHPAREY